MSCAGYDMQFDIKYAYFNFLQSIQFRSTPSPLLKDKLAEIDSDPDEYESWWILISQPAIFNELNSSECWRPKVNGTSSNSFRKQCEKTLFLKPCSYLFDGDITLPSANTILSFISNTRCPFSPLPCSFQPYCWACLVEQIVPRQVVLCLVPQTTHCFIHLCSAISINCLAFVLKINYGCFC